MMAQFEIDQEQALVTVKGELTQTTVMAAHQSFLALQGSPKTWQFDFSQVTQVDSCAVALLIEWKKSAQQNSNQITFQNLPEALVNIAQLSQVESLILA